LAHLSGHNADELIILHLVKKKIMKKSRDYFSPQAVLESFKLLEFTVKFRSLVPGRNPINTVKFYNKPVPLMISYQLLSKNQE